MASRCSLPAVVGAHALVLMAALQGCASDSPTDPGPSCGDVVSTMLMECGEAFEVLTTCIDNAGTQACNAENRAHGECLDAVWADVDEDLRDPAFSRYLCELASMPSDDCAERIAACED